LRKYSKSFGRPVLDLAEGFGASGTPVIP
jgi:hypothetical protein